MELEQKREVKKEGFLESKMSAWKKRSEESEVENSEDGFNRNRKHRKHLIRDLVIFALVIFLIGVGYALFLWKNTERENAEEIREKIHAFVKEKMVKPGTEVKISDFIREGSLYRVVLTIDKEVITAYASADGKNFFPQAIDMNKETTTSEKTPPPVTEAKTKKEKSVVDLFIMTYCPYGLQMQKGILPVIEKLGDSIDFSMRYVGYTMHGKKEFNENIRQYCIEKEMPTAYSKYLSCFTASSSGDSLGCGKEAKLNENKIAACVAATDKKFELSEKYDIANEGSSPFGIDKDLNEKYGVQGSPTLVVNGDILNSARDPKSILRSICSGFTVQPKACSDELSSSQPSPGFGTGTSPSSTSDASCN